MSDALNLSKLLASEGFDTDEAQAQALEVLYAHKLSRPGKAAIAADKREALREVLASSLFKVCGHPDCDALSRQAGRTGQDLVRVQLASCAVCGGSSNRRAALATARTLKRHGVSRVLVVGGTPNLHAELETLFAAQPLSFTFVDGASGTHTAKDAATHLRWAQIAVVWGSTPLPHKVSKLYTDDPPAGLRVIQLSRRGIEALCQELRRSFGD